jgi:hypothetical protein
MSSLIIREKGQKGATVDAALPPRANTIAVKMALFPPDTVFRGYLVLKDRSRERTSVMANQVIDLRAEIGVHQFVTHKVSQAVTVQRPSANILRRGVAAQSYMTPSITPLCAIACQLLSDNVIPDGRKATFDSRLSTSAVAS